MALAAIPEDESPAPALGEAAPLDEVLALIDGLETAGACRRGARERCRGRCAAGRQPALLPRLPPAAVDEKVRSIMSAAEDAILVLKNTCKTELLRLPAKVRRRRWWGWACEQFKTWPLLALLRQSGMVYGALLCVAQRQVHACGPASATS